MEKNQIFAIILAVVGVAGLVGALTRHAAGEPGVALGAALVSLVLLVGAYWTWRQP